MLSFFKLYFHLPSQLWININSCKTFTCKSILFKLTGVTPPPLMSNTAASHKPWFNFFICVWGRFGDVSLRWGQPLRSFWSHVCSSCPGSVAAPLGGLFYYNHRLFLQLHWDRFMLQLFIYERQSTLLDSARTVRARQRSVKTAWETPCTRDDRWFGQNSEVFLSPERET